MEAIYKTDSKARTWLADIRVQSRWSKHAFDPLVCCDENKTNFVESFNVTLAVERCKPVLTLLQNYNPNLVTTLSIIQQGIYIFFYLWELGELQWQAYQEREK